jgi:hypothetical protein
MQIHRRYLHASRLRQRRGLPQKRPHCLFAQRLAVQLGQSRLDAALSFLGRQVEDPDVLPIRATRTLRLQRVVSPTIGLRWVQILAVHVPGERPRLTHQPLDDVTVVDPVLLHPTQPRHPLHHFPRVPDLDLLDPNPHFDLLADQPRRHRIRVLLHPDRAPSLHTHTLPDARLQPSCRQRPQQRLLLGELRHPPLVPLRHHPLHQLPVRFPAGEVPAATQEQRLLHPLLEMTVRRLHVSVLVAARRVRRLRRHTVVSQQRTVLRGELLRVPVLMHCQRHPIRPVPLRHATQRPERVLQALAQTDKVLPKTERRPLPVRVGQHEVVDQVGETPSLDRHPKLVHRREVRSPQPARRVLLREEHFPGLATQRLPLTNATLERPTQ